MTPELENKLKDRFKDIFEKDFYFEISDGWYNLVYNLCSELEVLSKNYPESKIECVQCKSKFAGLRFYIVCDNPDAFESLLPIISKFETESFHICEECGKPGKTRSTRYWLYTFCDSCEEHFKSLTNPCREIP